MNWIKPISHSATVATLLFCATASAAVQNVTALVDDSVSTFALKSDYFVKQQSIASKAFTLPAPVLEKSAKGYVKVSQQGQEVWLDIMDVTLFPPESAGDTGCIPTSTGATAKTGRGAGNPCP